MPYPEPDFNRFPVIAGVRAGTAIAGIKQTERDDIALFELAAGSSAAAVFTRNVFCAAPVLVAKENIASTSPRYLLINSGNANAGTGPTGLSAARQCCRRLADLGNCRENEVLPFSTGVIGVDLPVEKIAGALPAALAGLSENNWRAAARAILTTDTVAKAAGRSFELAGHTVNITGIAKGSGMIRPDMATMLAYIATDAAIESSVLHSCLHKAVALSFNRITVDGDTSTNDACVLMASGRSGARVDSNDRIEQFQSVLNEICVDLAKQIIADGEGATKLVTVQVEAGKDETECKDVAYTIAHSPLVKTALFASDPNWGRILAAVGRTGLSDLNLDKIEIYLGDVCIVKAGGRDPEYTEEKGNRVMQQNDILIRVVLHRGAAAFSLWTCDLSYDYVRINAEYRT